MPVSSNIRTAILAVAWAAVPAAARAADELPRFLNAGEARQQLERTVSINWSHLGLRQIQGSLADSYTLAIVLDRRVDPDQAIELRATNERLAAALERLAAARKLGLSVLGPVVYLGPPAVAGKLRTLSALRRQEVEALPAPRRKSLLAQRTWQWKALSQPRQLVEALGREAECEIVGSDAIEHDLWPAAAWPAMSWVDRLTLVAAQFDLTFRISTGAAGVELVPIPERVTIERRIPVSKDAAGVAARWARQVPTAEFRAEGSVVVATGRIEELEIVQPNKPARPTKQTIRPGKKTYQLRFQDVPLDRVLAQVGPLLEVEFDLDRAALDAAGIKTDRPISIDVRDASLDELLDAIFGPLGLTHERSGKTIRVRATP